MIATSRDSGRLSRAAALFACLVVALATVWAGAARGQNHFSVVAGAAGSANSAVKAEASPEGEIYDGQNACCNNIKLLDDVIHLGLVDAGDDVDGYSYLLPTGALPGGNAAGLDYSLAPGVAGMRPGTIFRGGFWATKGIIPPAALGLQNTDDLDAYSFQNATVPYYFSLAAGSTSLGTIPANPGDILDGGPAGLPAAVVISCTRLGLQTTDDIDALAVWDSQASGNLGTGDDVLFSLTPGSPTLAVIGGTARDVLRATITAGANPSNPTVYTTGAFLGIPPGGDLDSLDDTNSNPILVLVDAEAVLEGSSGSNGVHQYTLHQVDSGADGLYGTPDDIVTPLPGESVFFQSLDPGVATVSPPSGVTNGSGEVQTVVGFASVGTTHVEAAVPAYGVEHYTEVVTLHPVPVMGFWARVLLVLAFGAVSFWWLRRWTRARR